jgi:hypothetical protein
MRSILMIALAAAGVGLFVSPAVAGPTVNYYITTVNPTATGGTWQVYADVSDDNDGLSGFEIDVLGGGGVQITSVAQLEAPDPVDPSDQYAKGAGGVMGFNKFGSNGALIGGNLIGITSNQTTNSYGPTDNPTYDMGILVGVGQEDSSASPQNGTQGPINGSGFPTGLATPVWTYQPLADLPGGNGLFYPVAGTLIEQGSYSISGPGSLTVRQNPNSFTEILGTGEAIFAGGLNYPGFYPGGDNVPWGLDPYQLGNTPIAAVTGDTIAVPEPASLGLLATIGIGLLGTSRRLRRI